LVFEPSKSPEELKSMPRISSTAAFSLAAKLPMTTSSPDGKVLATSTAGGISREAKCGINLSLYKMGYIHSSSSELERICKESYPEYANMEFSSGTLKVLAAHNRNFFQKFRTAANATIAQPLFKAEWNAISSLDDDKFYKKVYFGLPEQGSGRMPFCNDIMKRAIFHSLIGYIILKFN
jgi:hypothetical protein